MATVMVLAATPALRDSSALEIPARLNWVMRFRFATARQLSSRMAFSVMSLYSNIRTRIGESGMQRAIGMSAASLYKTFLWEGAYYGIFASAIGAVLSYVCCIFVGAAQTDTLQMVAVSVAAILEAAAVSVDACLAATAIPLCAISRMNIVGSIETGE